MPPLKLLATANREPSAEQTIDDHHPNGAPVLVQDLPESVETLIAKSDAATKRRPSAEQATAQLVLEPMKTACHVCPESAEEYAWLMGSAPANVVPSAEQAIRPRDGALVNNDQVNPASMEI